MSQRLAALLRRHIRELSIRPILFTILLWIPCSPVVATPVDIILIQLEVSEEVVSSRDSFETHLEASVASALAASSSSPEIIVFPEYTGLLFGTAAVYGDLLDTVHLFDELVARAATRRKLPPDLPTILTDLAPVTERVMDDWFGTRATELDAIIVAGTYIAVDDSTGTLRNRLVVYGPDGARRYEQDKVYLTPIEIDTLGITAGRVDSAQPFIHDGVAYGFTICRDTFFAGWESELGEVDLWFDLKANGIEFTNEVAAGFLTALPERVANTGVPVGATVCLVGTLVDMLWEGRSSIVVPDGSHGFSTVAAAESVGSGTFVYYRYHR